MDNNLMNSSKKTFVIAQFSDCHLFSDKQAKHLGANVWQNLNRVLTDIAKRKNIDSIVFTGDLTQDHSESSYQHFVHAVQQAKLVIPVYFLAGNHDDHDLLTKHLIAPTFQTNKTLGNDFWQIQLLDSKSDTPSGLVSSQKLQTISQQMDRTKFQLLMMHHHPIDVGYYIDKHGLLSKEDFWKKLAELNEKNIKIKGIACGHVHRGVHLSKQNIDIYTCPATSVQFGDTKAEIGSILPSYQLLYLERGGTMTREIIVF